MNKTEVPCGPIYTLEEICNDPQVQHLGIAQTVESATLGPTIRKPRHDILATSGNLS